MASFVTPFLSNGLSSNRQSPSKCTRKAPVTAQAFPSMDWDLFGGVFHNEGSTWSGQGDMWVTVSAAAPDEFAFEAGDNDDTVTYGDNTVFASDLCDVTGDGCEEGGTVPADALKPIGKEVKAEVDTPETKDRVIISYSNTSVFKDDDSVPQ